MSQQPRGPRAGHRRRGAGLPLPRRAEASLPCVEGSPGSARGGRLLFTTYYQVEPRRWASSSSSAPTCARATRAPPEAAVRDETVTKVPVQRQLKMEFGFRRSGRPRARVRDAPGGAGGIGDAHRRPQRGRGRVIVQFASAIRRPTSSTCVTSRDLPLHVEAAVRQSWATTASTRSSRSPGGDPLAAKEELQRLCNFYASGSRSSSSSCRTSTRRPGAPRLQRVNQAIQRRSGDHEAWAEYNQACRRRRRGEQAVRSARLPSSARTTRSATPCASSPSSRSTARRRTSRASGSTSRRWARSCRSWPQGDRGRQGEGSAAAPPARRGAREVSREDAAAGRGAILAAILLFSSVYTLGETEQAILTQFGGRRRRHRDAGAPPEGALRPEPAPLRERWLSTTATPTRSPPGTRSTSGWTRTPAGGSGRLALLPGRARRARRQSRLDDIVDGETRNAVASLTSSRSCARRTGCSPARASSGGRRCRGGGEDRNRRRRSPADPDAGREDHPEFGVELVDVRFKRLNYTESVQQAVFQRMIAERKRIAERSRPRARGGAEIRARRSATSWRELGGLQVGPGAQGQGRREGDDDLRARLRARPGFYEFWKSMETLQAALDKDARSSSPRLGAAEVPEGLEGR